MDDAIEKMNSNKKFNPSNLNTLIDNLKTIVNSTNNTINKFKNYKIPQINYITGTTILPEEIALISLAYKNILFTFNSFLRIKNIKNEIELIYPLTIQEIQEKYNKWKDLFKFKNQLKYKKLGVIDQLTHDLGMLIISYNIFDEPTFINQIDFIIQDSKNEEWKNKLNNEIKRKIRIRIKDYQLVIRDFKLIPELQLENICNKRELIEEYFFTLKNSINPTSISEILKILELENELKLVNESNFINLPPLLDNKIVLINKYLNVCEEKVISWMTNLKNNILNSRLQVPSVDEDNKFISLYFITLLDLIRNQIEPIKFSLELRSGLEKIICKEVNDLLSSIKDQLNNEFNSAVALKSPPGYEEFVIMISNSSLKLAQYANDSLESAMLSNQFVSLMKESCLILANFITFTLKPLINCIFTDKWYDNQISLIPTITDFFSDYKTRLNEYNFYILVSNLQSSITSLYFKQIRRKRSVIYDGANLKIREDCSELNALFYKNNVDIKFDLLSRFKNLLSYDGEMLIDEIVYLKNEIPKSTIICIIEKRELDNKKEIRKKIEEILGEEKKGFFEKIFG